MAFNLWGFCLDSQQWHDIGNKGIRGKQLLWFIMALACATHLGDVDQNPAHCI